MRAKETLAAGVTGTAFMTMFSYLVSELENENFSEPERLGQLARNLLPALHKKEQLLAGWAAHFGVGLAFAAVYDELWERRKPEPTLKNNLAVGLASGIVAVGIWKATFKAHPLPPKLSYNKYYLQLVPAHMVFAVFAGIAYKMVKEARTKADLNDN